MNFIAWSYIVVWGCCLITFWWSISFSSTPLGRTVHYIDTVSLDIDVICSDERACWHFRLPNVVDVSTWWDCQHACSLHIGNVASTLSVTVLWNLIQSMRTSEDVQGIIVTGWLLVEYNIRSDVPRRLGEAPNCSFTVPYCYPRVQLHCWYRNNRFS